MAVAAAVALPTLLAYNQTPASTLYNQLLALALWGGCLVAGSGLPGRPTDGRRALEGALVLLAGAMLVTAVRLGSIQELSGWALLLASAALLQLGATAPHGGPVARGLALGCLLAGLLGALIGVLQVFWPSWTDGLWIARSGLPGRAVGNVRQPNHLATLLLMGCVGLVWYGRLAHWPWWRVGMGLAVLVLGLVLTASRTGLWFGVPLLVLWGGVDRELPGRWRLLLVATPLMAAAAWAGMHWWSASGAGVFGAETRLDHEGAGSPSRIAILKNAWTLLQMHPWTGVGYGEFNRAWTLTPFPDRPIAFFDHTHNLPLQLLVELGWPLGLAVLLLLLAGFGLAARMAWRARGDGALQRRAALMLVLIVGVHSLLEYPLWYAYFLLPTALAFGLALAPEGGGDDRAAEAAGRSARWPKAVGVLLLLGSAWTCWDYRSITAIYAPGPSDLGLVERVERGQRSWLLGRHADYAAATALGANAAALQAAQRTGHQLIDARLLMAWARSLHAEGETDKARYLVARLREFRSPDGAAWLAACDEDPAAWMCQAPQRSYRWQDF